MEQRDITQELLSWKNFKEEFVSNLPVWFLFIEGLGIHNIFMSNVPDSWFAQVGIARSYFALLMLPLSIWFYAYYRVRLRESLHTFDRRKVHARILFVAFGVPFLMWAWHMVFPFFRFELSAHSLHRLFELSNLVWAVIIGAFTLYYRGFPRLVTFFGVAFLYGLLLENTGIYLNFFFEPNYVLYLLKFPAPFATMLGWCIVFSCCIWLIEFFRERSPRLQASAALSALATTALAISADAQLDPLASFPGMWWQWNELLPPFWFGVPFCNYAAWFGAFFAFSFAYYRIFDRQDLSIWQKNWNIFLYVPSVTLLAGFVWLGLMLVWETIIPQGDLSYPTVHILWETYAGWWPY
jgi:Carotenoid biosynthesis protein